jgi:FtsH-binding integral membrane protein
VDWKKILLISVTQTAGTLALLLPIYFMLSVLSIFFILLAILFIISMGYVAVKKQELDLLSTGTAGAITGFVITILILFEIELRSLIFDALPILVAGLSLLGGYIAQRTKPKQS